MLLPALIGITILLALILLGPTLLARAQVNRFSVNLVRMWTRETLIPTDEACPPIADASVLSEMQARLNRAEDADVHAALHRGQMACLDGDVDRAGDIWQSGLDAMYVTDPILLLDAAIARFTRGEVLETSAREQIGGYASRQSRTWEKDDLKTAIRWQEMAIAYDPAIGNGRKLAGLYKKAGRNEDAKAVWTKLQNIYAEGDERYWLARAQMLEGRKDFAGAMAAYLKAADLAQKPGDVYRDYLSAGRDGRRAKAYDEAIAAYEQAITLEPENIKAYLGLNEVLRTQKRYDEARQWLEQVKALFPDDHRPDYQLGLIARMQKRYDEALTYFDHSLALKPDNPYVIYDKALALDGMQRRSDAIEVLRQAIEHHSNPPQRWEDLLAKWRRYADYAQDPDRWWEKGQAAEKERDWAQAAAIYAEGAARAQPPDDYRLLAREALMHRYLKEWDQAAAIYEDLARRYPDRLGAYLGRGDVARIQGKYEEARQWFEQAQERFSDDYRPPYYLGLVARAQGENEEAVSHFDRSLALKPDYPYALYAKAHALNALERTQEAIQTLKRAIELHPHPPESWQEQLKQWQGE